jgi:uncharacterized protein YcbK (DUF882 family)
MESAHFKDTELACHHCEVNLCKQELLDALEALRLEVGLPIVVDDAYRCPVHNAAVGGVPDSQHVQGIAADIHVVNMTASQLEAYARRVLGINGIGRSDTLNYIHIDTRTTPAKWCYAKTGAVEAYYPAG